jgi:hypothetical protein
MLDGLEVRAPKQGYDLPAKAQYREDVWSAIAPATRRYLENDRARWLILPSREGLEIEVAVKHGIPPEKIVCVDKSPALIATSHWRKKWPQCEFIGKPVGEVGAEIAKRNQVIVAANLDLCGNFSEENITELEAFLVSAPKTPDAVIAVTMMKGREGSALLRFLNQCDEELLAEKRMRALMQTTRFGDVAWRVLAQGDYRAARMPVAWAVLQRVSAEAIFDEMRPLVECAAKLDRRATSAFTRWHKIRQATGSRGAGRTERFYDLGRKCFTEWKRLDWKCNEVVKRVRDAKEEALRGVLNPESVGFQLSSECVQLHNKLVGISRVSVPKTHKGWGIF